MTIKKLLPVPAGDVYRLLQCLHLLKDVDFKLLSSDDMQSSMLIVSGELDNEEEKQTIAVPVATFPSSLIPKLKAALDSPVTPTAPTGVTLQ